MEYKYYPSLIRKLFYSRNKRTFSDSCVVLIKSINGVHIHPTSVVTLAHAYWGGQSVSTLWSLWIRTSAVLKRAA